MRDVFLSVVLAAILPFGSGASASILTFDFTGTSGQAPSYTFTEGGLSVTVTAGGVQALGNHLEPLVTGNAEGLGVIAGPALALGCADLFSAK